MLAKPEPSKPPKLPTVVSNCPPTTVCPPGPENHLGWWGKSANPFKSSDGPRACNALGNGCKDRAPDGSTYGWSSRPDPLVHALENCLTQHGSTRAEEQDAKSSNSSAQTTPTVQLAIVIPYISPEVLSNKDHYSNCCYPSTTRRSFRVQLTLWGHTGWCFCIAVTSPLHRLLGTPCGIIRVRGSGAPRVAFAASTFGMHALIASMMR